MKFGQAITLAFVGAATGGSQVYAQSSASSAAAATTSASANIASGMIPAGISTSCSAFLKSIDTLAEFKNCVEPLYNVTANFNPLTGLAAENVTAATITGTLTSLCVASNKCPDSSIRSYLGQFYGACGAELTSSNAAYSDRIREMYDYLYIVNPFRSAVCAKNGATQKYCVLEIGAQAAAASASTTSGNATIANSTNVAVKLNSFAAAGADLFAPVLQAAENLVIYTPIPDLARRFFPQLSARAPGDAQTSYMTPNATTYRTTSLPYLFLQPNMSSSLLCSTCTRSVMAAYISWESQVPYALGLSSSPILGGQETLWNGIQGTCGTNFTDAITQQAGIYAANGTTGFTGDASKVGGRGVLSGFAIALVATVAASLV